MDSATIKRLLRETRHTQKELAAHLGVDPAAITRRLRGERRLRLDEAPKVAEFFGLAPAAAFAAPASDAAMGTGNVDLRPAAGANANPDRGVRDLPVFGSAQGGPDGMDLLWKDPESTLTKWKTPLFEDESIVELPVDQRTVTRRYTQKAIDFVKAHRDQPFFVYLPHSMPHIPLYVPDDVRDPDPKRAYINTIEHIDTEVGRLLDVLDELQLSDNTYVIYTTDNGPWLPFKHHGGSAGPLRNGKGTTFEGGQRVPCLIRGPGVPPGTTCQQLTGTIDVLPTIANLIGKPLPTERKIDGIDVSPLWLGEIDQPVRDEFLYYTSHGEIEGIRQGNWKLLVKKPRGNNRDASGTEKPPRIFLFDLASDLGEQSNLAAKHPKIVERLRTRMEAMDDEITQNAREPWRKS